MSTSHQEQADCSSKDWLNQVIAKYSSVGSPAQNAPHTARSANCTDKSGTEQLSVTKLRNKESRK